MPLVKYGSIARQRLGRSLDKLHGAYIDALDLVMLTSCKGASCRGRKLRKRKQGSRSSTSYWIEASILLPLNKKLYGFIKTAVLDKS